VEILTVACGTSGYKGENDKYKERKRGIWGYQPMALAVGDSTSHCEI